MISLIEGEVIRCDEWVFTLFNNGWGVDIELAQEAKLITGHRYSIFTVMDWGVQQIKFYGFLDQPARDLFVRLLTTPSIGANIALQLTRAASVDTIVDQIKKFNFAFFARLNIRQLTPHRILAVIFRLQKWYGCPSLRSHINVSVIKSLLKMGYDLEMVYQALTRLYQNKNTIKPTVDALLDVLNQRLTFD